MAFVLDEKGNYLPVLGESASGGGTSGGGSADGANKDLSNLTSTGKGVL